MEAVRFIPRIKAWREKRGLTQDALAAATGISRVSIARYELGVVMPSLENAHKIASALGCTVDDLLKEA